MSKVRLIVQGSVTNYEGYTEAVKRACAYVEENEPGTLVYECFADEERGRTVWHEIYADADALLTHYQNMMETGLAEQAMQAFQPEQVTVLTRITDPRVEDLVQQFGAVKLHGLAGVVR